MGRRKNPPEPPRKGLAQVVCRTFLHAIVLAPMATKSRKKKSASKRRPLVKGKPAKKAAKAPKPDRPAGTDPKRVAAILAKLDEAYPSATCELNHENAFQQIGRASCRERV